MKKLLPEPRFDDVFYKGLENMNRSGGGVEVEKWISHKAYFKKCLKCASMVECMKKGKKCLVESGIEL